MAIILKEAFRYQNYLDSLLESADYYLRQTNNVMNVVETHMRSKAQDTIPDVVRDNSTIRELNVAPDGVVEFVLTVLNEKAALSVAINNAKIQHCPEMDMEAGLNRARQRVQKMFARMAALKNRTTTTVGKDYCFNAEGNQTPYTYEVEVKTSADFDRSNLKKHINSLSDESTRISNAIDYWVSSIPVDHEPLFNINDTFEELVESVASK